MARLRQRAIVLLRQLTVLGRRVRLPTEATLPFGKA
jgi:hypothetical protein